MSGNRYVLDTNAIIALLQGNDFLIKTLKEAEYIGVSFVSVIEFLSFPSLSLKDKTLFEKFIGRLDIITLPINELTALDTIATYRKESGLKIPDVIIAISTLNNDAVLITNDKDFKKIPALNSLNFTL
ncbi:MAG: PIN domain-containing protein [Chitinophagaceae bacterium]|nr:PIN domain-containing protein [Chitinophagaceae bacterium]